MKATGIRTEAVTGTRFASGVTGNAVRLAVPLLVALAMTGCREDEQNRPTRFEPGVYQGHKPAELTPEQRRALEQRGMLQR